MRVSRTQQALDFLIERGASVFTEGSVYARTDDDTLEVWFVTNRWEDHALRLQAYELEAETMRRFPEVFVDLHVIPPSSVHRVPADAEEIAP